jgi:hypothetical protein
LYRIGAKKGFNCFLLGPKARRIVERRKNPGIRKNRGLRFSSCLGLIQSVSNSFRLRSDPGHRDPWI